MREKDIGALMKQISDKLQKSADASLKKSGLTMSQARALEYVHSQGGKTTQKEVEDYLGVSHPTVVGLISRLEKSGFLNCYQDAKNRRNKIVQETEKSQQIADLMYSDMDYTEKQIINGFSEEETEQLRKYLLIIYSNIS